MYTGNLDFTGFLGLKKYLWYVDKSGNESSIKMSTELCAKIELVSKELNRLAAILHVYAGGFVIIFQKEKGNTFTLSVIFIVKSKVGN